MIDEKPFCKEPQKSDHTPMTPMIAQYMDIKKANPGMLLFYRMGDFYELFFEDAEEASSALGIALTKRGKHQGYDIPMCGVPVHTAEDYLHKLIALGFRVAVCEQIESPEDAKKRGSKSLVARDVVRLVTPGTLTEDKLLVPFESNFFMTLGCIKIPGQEFFGLSWVDISTGVFYVTEVSIHGLRAEISCINPREIIVADSVFYDPQFASVFDELGKLASPLPDVFFDATVSLERVLQFYKVATLEGFDKFSLPEMSAICGAIAYLEKTQKSECPALSPPKKKQVDAYLFIDPATRLNLEILQAANGTRKGSLFNAINNTVTGVGARLLAERLMSPLVDCEKIQKRLNSVSFFLEDRALCETLRGYLKTVADMPRALSRLSLNRGGPRDLGALSVTFEAAQLLRDCLKEKNLSFEISKVYEVLASLPQDYACRLKDALSDQLPILKRDGGFIRSGYNQELDETRSLRDETRRIVARMEADLISETAIKSLKIRHNNILGYYIEITAQNHAVMTANQGRFIHRQTMANAMRFTTSELIELETKISHAAERTLALEFSIFDQLVSEAVGYSEIIRQISEALAVLDLSSSLAVLAARENFCRPHVDGSLAFDIVSGRHLVVEQALRSLSKNPFVANNCNLSPASSNTHGAIWLLTGPNMGGKSTFLRQNALIVIMAQMGSFVPAEKAHIGIVDRLFSRVGASDDLARGRSTFMVEMVETAVILNQAGARALVILDEIGRGTATFDGLSIAWAAVEHLHNHNQCRTLFATHFHEMSFLSGTLVRLKNITMRVKEWKGDLIFLHEVEEGAADRSYGIHVARLAGLPDTVIKRAQYLLSQLEHKRDINTLESDVDTLPLFQAVSGQNNEVQKHRLNACDKNLKEELGSIDLDATSPLEALRHLYHLKLLAKAES